MSIFECKPFIYCQEIGNDKQLSINNKFKIYIIFDEAASGLLQEFYWKRTNEKIQRFSIGGGANPIRLGEKPTTLTILHRNKKLGWGNRDYITHPVPPDPPMRKFLCILDQVQHQILPGKYYVKCCSEESQWKYNFSEGWTTKENIRTRNTTSAQLHKWTSRLN